MTLFNARWRIATALALLLLPYALMGIWLGEHSGSHAVAGYALAALALLWLLACIARTWRRLFLLHLPLFVLGAVFVGYTMVRAELPTDGIAYVLATSSWEEMLGYFGLPQPQRLLLLLLAGAAVYLWLSLRLPPQPLLAAISGRARWLAFGTLAAMAAYAGSMPEEFMTGLAASPLIGSAMFVAGPLSTAQKQVSGGPLKRIPYGAHRVQSAEVHILVVGESSRRRSWSAYGYARPSTPFLATLKREAVFLQHAVTDSNSTVYAVPMLLTGIGPENYDARAIRGNLLDLAREAGYYTSWLVNQDDRISKLIGVEADAAFYSNAALEQDTRKLQPDGTLLSEFERQLAHRGSPLFIGLHVDGSHWAYFNRYPQGFERFGSAEGLTFASFHTAGADHRMLDSYDNSILYTDWFLQQIIEQARKLDLPATVTYLSDHGESLYALDGRSGHGATDFAPSEFEIPAFVWMNAAYRAAHPDKVRALIGNASKQLRTHDFFYSLADLMGIVWPGAKPDRSFVSESFVPDAKSRYLAGGKLTAAAD